MERSSTSKLTHFSSPSQEENFFDDPKAFLVWWMTPFKAFALWCDWSEIWKAAFDLFSCCSIALLYMLQRATWWREKGLCRAVGQRVEFTGFEWWSTTFSAHANTGPFQCNIRILPWLPLQKTDSKRPIKPLAFYFLPQGNKISFN